MNLEDGREEEAVSVVEAACHVVRLACCCL